MKRILLGIFASILLLSSCTEKISQPQLLRCHIDSVGLTSVTVSFDAEVPANETGHYVGLEFSLGGDPMDAEMRLNCRTDALPGRHTYTLSHNYLKTDSLYNVRAYVYLGKEGYEWGEMTSCTPTLILTSEMVDLGLSVNWRSYNLGTSEIALGKYYQWGDTQGYGSDVTDGKYFNYYDSDGNSTYKWANGSDWKLTKYCPISRYGDNEYTDSYSVLEMSDDAARVALGGNWRVPTLNELSELYKHCKWTYLTVKGIKGALIYSKKEGYTDNFIFLPCSGGSRRGNEIVRNDSGCYWSSELVSSSPETAWSVEFGVGSFSSGHGKRAYGYQIRPVADKTE